MPPFPIPALRVLARPLFAAAALAASSFAWAEPNPYYIGVSQAFAHDSNLFRNSTAEVPDKYSITGLLAGIDQPFGRQRFYANGRVSSTTFEDVKSLNNTSYSFDTGLDWSTINQLAGSFNVSVNENLASYGSSVNQPQLSKKNIETLKQANARVQLGLVSLLSLEGSLAYRRVDYSAVEFATSEILQNTYSLGLKYRPSGLLTLGLAYRATRGEYPGVLLAGASGGSAAFRRNDVDLTATWFATGLSTVNGRLSYGKQTSDAFAARDFSGATGSLGWTYVPTGKLTFNTSISRDTGAEASFSNPSQTQLGGRIDNSRLTTTFDLNAVYVATAKIKVNAGFRSSQRTLSDEQTAPSGAKLTLDGSDTLNSLSLGVNYEPARNWLLGCSASYETRSAKGGLSSDYDATIVNCSGKFTLQ